MTTQQEIGRLTVEAEDLPEFLKEACRLRGKGLVRASVEAGLSGNTLSSFVLGKRSPSPTSAYKLARYFGVPVVAIMRLAGQETGSVPAPEMEGVAGEVRSLVMALDEQELREWMGFGEMLLLRRERRLMEEARGEVEGE